jgi:hypothetical protein
MTMLCRSAVIKPKICPQHESNGFSILFPRIDIVALLLQEGANPNASAGTSTIWRRFLKRHVKPSVTNGTMEDCQVVIHLLLQHGADMRNHIAPLVHCLRSLVDDTNCDFGKDSIALGTLRLLEIVLDYELNPNIISDIDTLWTLYLKVDVTISRSSTAAAAQRKILRSFLLRGANPEQIFENINDSASWSDRTMNRIVYMIPNYEKIPPFDNTLNLDIFLEHGLDPNARFHDQSIWERTIDAMRKNIQLWDSSRIEKVHWTTSLIILFLQYSADPLCKKLHGLLQLN